MRCHDRPVVAEATGARRTHHDLQRHDCIAEILNFRERLIVGSQDPSLAGGYGSDLRAQHDQLIGPKFVSTTGWTQVRHLPRYLQAMNQRMDKLDAGGALQRDGLNMQVVQELEQAYEDLKTQAPAGVPTPAAIQQIFWLLQELRVSLFAQELGNASSVSEKRLRQAIKSAQPQC